MTDGCTGLLHPIIQLMYGVEWEQPAIIAAALAQAAVHKDTLNALLTRSDEVAKSARPMPPILDFVADAGRDDKLKSYVTTVDGPNSRNIATEGLEDALKLVGRVKVGEADLEERTAEMIHAAVYVASCAAAAGGGRGGNKEPRYDFYTM